jgi:hypothetical protein
MATSHPEIGKELIARKAIGDETKAKLMTALEAFRAGWQG